MMYSFSSSTLHWTLASIAAMVFVMPVTASENAIFTFVPASGATCESIDRSALGMTRSRVRKSQGRVSGPLDPRRTSEGANEGLEAERSSESARWSIDEGSTTLSFSRATTSIDFAILSHGGTAKVYVYDFGKVRADTGLTLPLDDTRDLTIRSFSLCYGVEKSIKQAEIPVCGPEISCPANPALPQLITTASLDPNARKYALGPQGEQGLCACNYFDENGFPVGLQECDPNLGSNEEPIRGQAPPCVLPGDQGAVEAASRQGVETATSITYHPDPYVCVTVGGRRTCYSY